MKFGKRSEHHGGSGGEAAPRHQQTEASAQTRTSPSQTGGNAESVSIDRHVAQPTGNSDRLRELLVILLQDIRFWSGRYGYDAIPAIEVLRQVTSLAEAVEYAQRRDGGNS